MFVIQWVFLGDLRSAMIVSANIPFALFFAIIILVLQGEDANLLSLGAVDFGIIVDSAVIMMENIFRNFQSSPESRQRCCSICRKATGAPIRPLRPTADIRQPGWTERLRMIFVSALQVDKAVFFTAAITVTAFVPLFTMQGVEGQIFGPMARTYGYALAGALLATFTVTPVLASLLLPKHIEETETVIVRGAAQGLHAGAALVARQCEGRGHSPESSSSRISALAASRLGSEFLPALEEGNFWIRASMPPTISLDAGTEPTRKMREILLRHPEIITVVSQHGRPDNGSDASPFSNVELFAPIKPFDEWPPGLTKEKLTEAAAEGVRRGAARRQLNFSQYIQDNIEEALSGREGRQLGQGHRAQPRRARAARDQGAWRRWRRCAASPISASSIWSASPISTSRSTAKRPRATASTPATSPRWCRRHSAAPVATTVLEGDRQFGVAVRLDPKFRRASTPCAIIKVAYQTPSGTNAYIPLSELADISLDTGALFIYRERSQRYIPIKFSVRGRDLGSTVAEAQQRVAKAVQLPTGYRIVWSGEFDNLEAAKARLMIVVPITLLLIFVLLYSLFNSLRDSLLALAGIPFAIGGGLIALYLAGLDFSISAAIGFISLFGVAVMDGILNITYFRELRASGMSIADAVFQRRRAAHAADADDGAVRRRRPVPGGAVARHRQPGAAAAGHRGGRRHVHRTVAVAGRGAGLAQDLPVAGADRCRTRTARPRRRPKRRRMHRSASSRGCGRCRRRRRSPRQRSRGFARWCRRGCCWRAAPSVRILCRRRRRMSTGYTPETLASPDAGCRRPARAAAAFRQRRGRLAALVGGVSIDSRSNELIRDVGRAQSDRCNRRKRRSGSRNFNALAQRGLFFPQVGANYTPSDPANFQAPSSSGPGGSVADRIHTAHRATQHQLRA